MTQAKVGELNGRWALLLKVGLATYPIVLVLAISWAGWVTKETLRTIAFRDAGPRWTETASRLRRAQLREWVVEYVAQNVPPQAVRTRLSALEQASNDIRIDVGKNTIMLVRIAAKLKVEEP